MKDKIFEFINFNIVDRLFNKHTSKGFYNLIIAIILYYIGFSEDFITNAINNNWVLLIKLSVEYKITLFIFALILSLLAGYNIFRRELNSFELKQLANERDKKLLLLEINELNKKLTEEYKNDKNT